MGLESLTVKPFSKNEIIRDVYLKLSEKLKPINLDN